MPWRLEAGVLIPYRAPPGVWRSPACWLWKRTFVLPGVGVKKPGRSRLLNTGLFVSKRTGVSPVLGKFQLSRRVLA